MASTTGGTSLDRNAIGLTEVLFQSITHMAPAVATAAADAGETGTAGTTGEAGVAAGMGSGDGVGVVIVRLYLPAQEQAVELDWVELKGAGSSRRWDF